jgi:thioesterase domain-containing protein
VAFELARQLAAGGRMPAFVALFGAPYPDYFSRRGTLPERLRRALERAHKHARALLLRSPRQWRGYVAEELGERRARLERRRLAAADPVLALREKVESTTLGAVRAYVPRPFAGRLCLLLAGSSWERSGVEALRWESLAAQCDVLRGPDASTGSDMLRTHAAAFAELFRRC